MTPQAPHLLPESFLRRRTVLRAAAVAGLGATGALMSGCGGGGDGPGDAVAAADGRKGGLGGIDSGGTGHPTYFSAALDMAQPFMVAGVVFDTSLSGVVDADGQALAPADLGPGMSCRVDASAVVRVDGQATATAASVRIGDHLRGTVTSVDTPTRSVEVLGQRVVMTSKTVFGSGLSNGLADLRPGLAVQVWGELDATPGRIVATRVARDEASTRRVVRGVLTRYQPGLGRAEIGALTLSFAPGEGPVAEAGLAVGQVVRAVGPAAEDGGIGPLQSLRGDGLRLPAGRLAEVQGRVTRIETALRFDVDGVPCDIRQASERQGLAWLALGVRAEVHGRSDANGVLVADAVALEAPEPLDIEGSIDRVDAASRSFVLRGYTVVWTAATVFDGAGARLLAPRRRVAVLGRWSPDHTRVVASRIKIEA